MRLKLHTRTVRYAVHTTKSSVDCKTNKQKSSYQQAPSDISQFCQLSGVTPSENSRRQLQVMKENSPVSIKKYLAGPSGLPKISAARDAILAISFWAVLFVLLSLAMVLALHTLTGLGDKKLQVLINGR